MSNNKEEMKNSILSSLRTICSIMNAAAPAYRVEFSIQTVNGISYVASIAVLECDITTFPPPIQEAPPRAN